MNGDKSILLDEKKIIDIIEDLNRVLTLKDKSLSIVIYGGSCLCIMTKFRESTFDIDLTSSDSELLKQCVGEMNLSGDLINDEIDVFLNKKESLELYKEYSNLKVYVPTLDYLLAMKIRACRNKDIRDIKFLSDKLDVRTIDKFKEIFTRYYSPIQFSKNRIEFLKRCLK